MSIKIVDFENIGEVQIVKTRKAKRLSISVRPYKGVRVAIPFYSSFRWAEKVVKDRSSWIIESLVKMKSFEDKNPPMEKKDIEILRKEAKKILPTRVQELAELYSFKFKSVSIRASKSRWGSCSPDNRINLSLFLLTVPEYLRDYVIVHELVHTEVKNHGSFFWSALNKIYENPKKLDKELGRFKPGVSLS